MHMEGLRAKIDWAALARTKHKAKKAPKKLAYAQEGKTRSLHKAKKAPKKLAYAQEGKTRRIHKAKKAP